MADENPRPKVLIVDDDPLVVDFLRLALEDAFALTIARDGKQAAALIRPRGFDVILSDISMPGLDGLELLRAIRAVDRDVPVILSTGAPTLDTAIKAIEFGALRYLTKPIEVKTLQETVTYAAAVSRMSQARREASVLLFGSEGLPGDRAGLETSLTRSLEKLWLAYQPIVSWSTQRIHAYEALVRSDDAELSRPDAIFKTATRLGREWDVGRAVRNRAADDALRLAPGQSLFVNVHPRDFDDPNLLDPMSPLSTVASFVVLEVSELASLETIASARERIAQLRELGFRIALDDMGAGHAGLATFAQLRPDIVKLDMALVRGCDQDPTRRRLIRSMTEACTDVGVQVVCEGIETAAERDAIVETGCDLLQGYFFARPARELIPVASGMRPIA